MKAIVCTRFGPPEVLHLKEVEKPEPKENEVLIRIYATPVTYGDLVARNFKNIPARDFHMPLPLLLPTKLYFGLSKPRVKILGSEFSGVIEATGKEVKRFKAGDQVMGYLGQKMGAYAEYVCMPEDGTIGFMPANLSHTEASVLPYGAIMGTSILRRVQIQPGDKVLVNGASGGIGSAALQVARNYGAEVTGVCGTPRIEYVKSLGADYVIDYTVKDFTENGKTYDLILDILGKSSFAKCKNSLKPDGIYLLASFKMKPVFQMLWTKIAGGKKVICAMANENPQDLVFIKQLAEAGKFTSPIDRVFPLDQAADAHRYAESGLKKGQVVLSI
jgi:NADPH:quinone reductase-like Zn-dependent oxidoreductase